MGQGSGQSKQPMGGNNPAGTNQQSNGGNQKKESGSDWRERRQQERKEQEEKGLAQAPMPKDGKPMPMGQTGTQPGNAGQTGGMGNNKSTPALPAEDAIAKQVWGHLPEKLRQQMNQYYNERFMPKYGDLLRQYYSSLAEREKAPKK
jgi:hypothetical protein